jgi:hypothetical protein
MAYHLSPAKRHEVEETRILNRARKEAQMFDAEIAFHILINDIRIFYEPGAPLAPSTLKAMADFRATIRVLGIDVGLQMIKRLEGSLEYMLLCSAIDDKEKDAKT